MAFQLVERVVPHRPVRPEPLVDFTKRFRSYPIQTTLRVGADVDQSGVAQDLQVLGHGGLADRQRLDEVAHRSLLAQQIQDLATGRFGDNFEHARHNAEYAPSVICVSSYVRRLIRYAAAS